MVGQMDLWPFPAKPQEGFAKEGRFKIRLEDFRLGLMQIHQLLRKYL